MKKLKGKLNYKLTDEQIDAITIRCECSYRGGGIEIDLSPFGKEFEGEKMVASQNYLGGGMLGKIYVKDTIRTREAFIEVSIVEKLEVIGEQLKRYYHSLTNHDDEWESQTYEANQRMPISAF